METLRKNPQTTILIAGATCVAAAAGLYFLWKKSAKPTRQPLRHKSSMEYFDPSDRESILSSIKVEYRDAENTILSLSTVKKIIDVSAILATPAFIELVHKNREARRAHLNNLAVYAGHLQEFATNVDTLLEKTTLEILTALNIPVKVWNESEVYHSEHNHDTLQESYSNLPHALKAGVRSRNVLAREVLIDMLKHHTAFLIGELDHAKEYKALFDDRSKIINVAQTRVSDRLFEKFGVEDEDYTAGIRTFSVDPIVEQLLVQNQECLHTLRNLTQEAI